MASGRVGRVEDDEDDVYDDGRFYEYKPRKISLDEILSGSERSGNIKDSLNSESAVYLEQKFEYQVDYNDLKWDYVTSNWTIFRYSVVKFQFFVEIIKSRKQ